MPSLPEQLTDNWITAARRQLSSASRSDIQSALRHSLGFASGTIPEPSPTKAVNRTVLLGHSDPDLERRLKRAGFLPKQIHFTTFDEAAAAKVKHFETYNRTPASQRIADIVAAARESPGAILVAEGDAALAGLFARAIAPISTSILDVGDVDPTSDDLFLEHLYIPGVRRAGDFQTAVAMSTGRLVIHDAGSRFNLTGVDVERRKLSAGEIVDALTRKPR